MSDSINGYATKKQLGYLWIAICILGYMALISVSRVEDAPLPDNRIQSLEEKIKSLNVQITGSEDGVVNYSSESRNLLNRVLDIEVGLLREKLKERNAVELDPTAKGYQIIETNTGTLFVSLQDITKYANGYKIHLHVGNPGNVDISNVKAKLTYGPSIDWGKVNFSDWQKNLKTIESTVDKRLLAGVWNKVTLVAAPAKEEEIGYLKVTLNSSEVFLREDYRKE